MKHLVVTINCKSKKVVYENPHQTAESAYEEYVQNIVIVKQNIRSGEEYIVARLRDGMPMAMETIKGE